ncbi:N-methylhydantoinase A [Paralcaligenes ureilyticus]|uniref:N-methylhydantoinase A n=2 Tax=Paralcaligenes ureilyticus TaxID=627131 RepID=A0A4R3M916_9BURK|nr:N-methylhydantoinase A [Paralcaligenes ureilyticus]
MRIGVEVGGTFTDLVALDEHGIRVLKVPSTPHSPDEGAFAALVASGIPLDTVEDLSHGSTVATNAVLERKGFLTAFVTTAGFHDILLLQRHGRSSIYDLAYQKPVPVVERADSFEVSERTLSDGSILFRLNIEEIESMLIPALKDRAYRAVAICLLNSYVNPENERLLRACIQAHLPDLSITLSSDITREFREYERASTTALSAYVQPVMDRYVSRFAEKLKEAGFKGRFSVMQSNGGRLPADAMRANAVTALLSGPAAGVTGAARQAARSGYINVITLDMGGTSTDVAVVIDGKPQLTNEFSIDGLPVRIPLLDINTVGAGGGSVIWIDDGGMLRVGPESAGASPGPACYMRGGVRPTITDAHVVRGTIQPENFLGGRMRIDATLARKVLEPIAAHFGMTVEEAADSAIQIANSNIVRAIQVISTERGTDPRDSVLVAYGGAGPLHAPQVALDLGIHTVVIPPNAGVISAYGLVASDFIQFESLTRRGMLDNNAGPWVREIFVEMRQRAIARAQDMNLGGELKISFVAEMRFVGQAFEVSVDLAESEMEGLNAARLRQLFGDMHQKLFYFGAEDSKPIEFVSFRLGLTAPIENLPLLKESEGQAIEPRKIDIYDGRAWHQAIFQSRSDIKPGKSIAGPALLDDPTCTLIVPAGWEATRDSADNMALTYKEVR